MCQDQKLDSPINLRIYNYSKGNQERKSDTSRETKPKHSYFGLIPLDMSGYIDFQELEVSDSKIPIPNLDIRKYRQLNRKSKMTSALFAIVDISLILRQFLISENRHTSIRLHFSFLKIKK